MRGARDVSLGLVMVGGMLASSGGARAGAALVERVSTFEADGLRIEDPSGIAFVSSGHFVLVDADIAGSSRSRGENLWEVALDSGRIWRALDLSTFTSEPTDVAYHPGRGTLFVSDDDTLQLHEVDISGRRLASIDLVPLGARDPEGVAYAPDLDRLFVADGRARQVLELTPEGQRVGGFDFGELPLENGEGIAYDETRGHLLLVGDDPPALFELTRRGELVAAYDLLAVGAVRPRGVTIAPASDGSGARHVFVADAQEKRSPDGRILELALARRPPGAVVRTHLVGDVDGFGFLGDEPGFAQGDLDHDGLLEPGERLPEAGPGAEPAGAAATTDAWHVVDAARPLVYEHVLDLTGAVPVWARLTLVVGGARALPGRRNLVRVDGHVIGEVIPTREKRLYAGMIGATVLELPPAALRGLADGRLRVEITRDSDAGSDDLMLDFSRLEVAVAERSAAPDAGPGKEGGDS